SMQVDSKSKGLFGALANSEINPISAHWPALVRRPEASVLISARDATAEFLQIQLCARRHFAGNRKIEGPPSLGIRSRYIERPDVPIFHEMLVDAERGERTAAQWYERKESDHQPIAVLKSMRLICALCVICIGNGAIHEFDPEQIQPVAGYQMIFSCATWRCDSHALDNGQQPGPISIGADKLQRVTKVAKIGS